MPTPSPNQPPQPPPLDLYSFSTCPDDVQHNSRAERSHHQSSNPNGEHVDSETSADGPSPMALESDISSPPREDSRSDVRDGESEATPSSRATTVSPAPPASHTYTTCLVTTNSEPLGSVKSLENDIRRSARQAPHLRSSTSLSGTDSAQSELSTSAEDDSICAPQSMGREYSSLRAIPLAPSSFLRPGSKFHGTQQSERQVYDVQVEIKHVDMRESFLCGYLRIQGLTEDHPTLTTYFEGEIIGSKYSFFTQHDDWGANPKVDLNHWGKFSAFRPFQKHARKGHVSIPDLTQRENIFMRWKEHFLVPDHRVRTISGASFEGFYYICFNQLRGEVSGIYFHSKSEKFQQLELKHVPNKGCFSATEFR